MINEFEEIEKEIQDWVYRHLDLVYESDGNWRICLPAETPYGTIGSYYVVRHGLRHRLEVRDTTYAKDEKGKTS